MCTTPKFLHIKSKTGHPFRIIVPCGKCYDCLNKKRSEFVYRAKVEMDSTINSGGCCYFVTLKYSDSNLVFWDSWRRNSQAKKELERISTLSKFEPFKYQNFILWKPHFQDFIKKCQDTIKKFSPSLLLRFALAGEYGTFSSRPHGHILFFCPIPLTKEKFSELFLSHWKLGHVEIDVVNERCINYVAKHYVKDDSGSQLQQKVSPRFLYYSRYGGSLGRDLLKSQRVVRNFVNCVQYDVSGKFKVPLPRFIRKRLKPDGFSDEELSEFEQKTVGMFAEQYYEQTGSSVVDHPCYVANDVDCYEAICVDNYYNNMQQEFYKQLTHKKQQFAKKILKLRKDGYFDTDNEKNV